jgi:hypothetical protein
MNTSDDLLSQIDAILAEPLDTPETDDMDDALDSPPDWSTLS